METFFLTTTITIEAKNEEEAHELVGKARKEQNSDIASDLLYNVEIDKEIE